MPESVVPVGGLPRVRMELPRVQAERKLLMGRITLLALLGLLAGCRAPMPSFNTLTPYDTSRVPPPTTGSYGQPTAQDQYYPGANQPPAGPLPGVSVGVRPTSAAAAVGNSPSRVAPAGLRWQSADDSLADRDTPLGSSPPAAAGASTSSAPRHSGKAPATDRSHAASGVPRETPIRIVESAAVPAEPPELRGMPVHDASREPERFTPQGRLLEISQLPPAGRER